MSEGLEVAKLFLEGVVHRVLCWECRMTLQALVSIKQVHVRVTPYLNMIASVVPAL